LHIIGNASFFGLVSEQICGGTGGLSPTPRVMLVSTLLCRFSALTMNARALNQSTALPLIAPVESSNVSPGGKAGLMAKVVGMPTTTGTLASRIGTSLIRLK
jgi:hypothetical protein